MKLVLWMCFLCLEANREIFLPNNFTFKFKVNQKILKVVKLMEDFPSSWQFKTSTCFE